MLKRVIIHVGPGKTGSSAIQYWLNSHRQILQENGIYYPSHTIDSNDVSSGNVFSVLSGEGVQSWVINKNKVKTLLSKFNRGSYHTLLLSSEFFLRWIVELNENFANAEFIIYVRNPIEVKESSYNQDIKRRLHTTTLSVPANFRFSLLDFIEKYFINDSRPKIILKAYSSDLFFGGSLVNDFLHTIGLDLHVDKQRIINPSYSLAVLEFKRYANHFPLSSSLQQELDRVLQGCPVGSRNYSLIPPVIFKKIKLDIVEQLENFIGKYSISDLKSFLDYMSNIDQRPFSEQQITKEELVQIKNYIKEQSPVLFDKLSRLVSKNSSVILPSSDYYECFNVVPLVEKRSTNLDIGYYKKLATKLLSSHIRDEAEVCREIALFFEQQNRIDIASKFMEAAHVFRPNGQFIHSKLSEYNNIEKQNSRDKLRKAKLLIRGIQRRIKNII